MNYQSRLKNIINLINQSKIDAAFISNPYNIKFLTGYNNFSNEERDCFLVITPQKSYLITDGRFTEAVKKGVSHFVVLERSIKTPIKGLFEKIIRKHQIQNLGVEEFDLKVSEYKSLKKIFSKLKGIDTSTIRQIKDSSEIIKIEAACDVADQAWRYAISKLNPNQREIDISSYFEQFLQKNQAKTSFETIVGFGSNSSVPHHETGNKKLGPKKGQFVLIDCGAKVDSYCSDMTRTVFWGKPRSQQVKIYETVLESQRLASEYIDHAIKSKKIITGREVDQVSSDYIKSAGFIPYNHSLGHGIGFEVHEAPTLSVRSLDRLEEGMVFSIEPGIYIPGFGGVRIEDLYVIEKTGLRQLTKSPKELKVIN